MVLRELGGGLAYDEPSVCYCTSVRLPYCLLLLSALVTRAHREWEALRPHRAVDYARVRSSQCFVKWR